MYVVVYLLHVLPVFVYFKSIVDCLVTSTPASRKPLKCYLNNDQTDVLLDLSKLHGFKFTDFGMKPVLLFNIKSLCWRSSSLDMFIFSKMGTKHAKRGDF